MQYQDYYKVLGVDKKADAKAIKNAYRKLAKKYHPDLHPDDADAHEKFKEINEAYEVLGDAEKRKKYDTFGANYNFQGGQNFDPSQYGYGGTYTYQGDGSGFSDFFNLFFGGAARQGGGSRGGSRIHFGNFGDLFGEQERGRSVYTNTGRNAPARTRYKASLEITLQEAYEGGQRTVRYRLSGGDHDVLVKWPQGITEGKKIRVRGEKFGIDGDLYVKIHVQGAEKLDGLDVVEDVRLLPWEALFGTKKIIDTFEKKLNIAIPAGVQSGKKIRIPNKGFRDRSGRHGDLYLRVQIVNPEKVSAEQRRLYEQLQKTESR